MLLRITDKLKTVFFPHNKHKIKRLELSCCLFERVVWIVESTPTIINAHSCNISFPMQYNFDYFWYFFYISLHTYSHEMVLKCTSSASSQSHDVLIKYAPASSLYTGESLVLNQLYVSIYHVII